jgi:cell pole-organizing protein PopZ
MNTTAQSGAASANRAPLFEEPVNYTEGEDAFLDEETLREMVSEMVRSELQGELGDRITRNVRKLVRREIFRALASREFE